MFASEHLQLPPQLVAQLFDDSNIPIVVTEALAGQPIVYANEAFGRLSGYDTKELIGRNCNVLQGTDRQQPEIAQIRNALKSMEPCDVVLRNYRRDGSFFYNHLYIFPVKSPLGLRNYFVGIQFDLTAAFTSRSSLDEIIRAVKLSNDVFLEISKDGNIIYANDGVEEAIGWKASELIGTSIFRLIPEERKNYVQAVLDAQLSGQVVRIEEGEYLHKDGSSTQVEWTISTGTSGRSVIAIGRNVTKRRVAERAACMANQRILAILESITDGFFSLDHQWRFTYVNQQGGRYLQRSIGTLIGKSVWDEFPEAVGGTFDITYREAIATGMPTHCETYYAPLGVWFEAHAYPHADGLTVFYRDITERKVAEAELIYSATHDSMTSLINRAKAHAILTQELSSPAEGHTGTAVLFIDIDRFKEVNDAFGHQIGDAVLIALAARLAVLGNEEKIPARISGDEFIFILRNVDSAAAWLVAHECAAEIGKPVTVEGAELTLGASIGIALSTQHYQATASELINRADTAMYAAKAAGRMTICEYADDVEESEKQRLQLRIDIPLGLKTGQFLLHYQPQIRTVDGRVVGAEALVRWRHPRFGLLAPGVFISLFEESPYMNELGAWILEEACRQSAQWKMAGHVLKISINVSARQLNNLRLPAMMRETVQRHELNPDCIKLEITESMLTHDLSLATRVLDELKAIGFRIALDDFGTGYSNFSYLHRFPVTAIKLDRSFLIDIERDPNALKLIGGIIALAKSLGLTVICEGVETEGQRRALEQTQCDQLQGYLLGRPVDAGQFYKSFLQPSANLS